MTNAPLRALQAGLYHGQRVPFFRIEWPPAGRSDGTVGAEVDVDGRNGNVVLVHLLDALFMDLEGADRIKSLTYSDRSSSKQAKEVQVDRPTKEEISFAISNWLAFCKDVGADSAGNTGPLTLDGKQTRKGKYFLFPSRVSVCWIYFTNGTTFACADGKPFLHAAPRAADPSGAVRKDWRKLAKTLQSALVERRGVPQEEMVHFTPDDPYPDPPAIGDYVTNRFCIIPWRVDQARRSRRSPTDFGFLTEFDLESGALTRIEVFDPSLANLLCFPRQNLNPSAEHESR